MEKKDKKWNGSFTMGSKTEEETSFTVTAHDSSTLVSTDKEGKAYTARAVSDEEKTGVPWVGFEPMTHCVLGSALPTEQLSWLSRIQIYKARQLT